MTAPGGHLELTFDASVLPDPAARYVVTLCGTTLFEADSAHGVGGLHALAEPVFIEPGDHEMTITGTAKGREFDRSLSVSIPRRSRGYSVSAVHCHVEDATAGQAAGHPTDKAQALGFRLAAAEAPMFQGAKKKKVDPPPVNPDAHASLGCSIKA